MNDNYCNTGVALSSTVYSIMQTGMHSASRANVIHIKAYRIIDLSPPFDYWLVLITRYLVPAHTISIQYIRRINVRCCVEDGNHDRSTRAACTKGERAKRRDKKERERERERERKRERECVRPAPRVLRFQWCRRVKSTSPAALETDSRVTSLPVTSYQSQLPRTCTLCYSKLPWNCRNCFARFRYHEIRDETF